MSKDVNPGFERAEGIGSSSDEIRTLEWYPAYFCELSVLRSNHIEEFTQIEIVKKKRFLRKAIEETYVYRSTLDEIRTSPQKSIMQSIIVNNFDFKRCILPNVHKLPCRGKIIAEKVPRDAYFQEGKNINNYILVKPNETCVILKNGTIEKVLEAGKHNFTSEYENKTIIDLVYFDLQKIKLLWGTSSYTTDQIRVNSSGSVIVSIINPNSFLINLFLNKNEYYEADLNDFVRDKIAEIIRTEMAKLSVKEIFAERDTFVLNLQKEMRTILDITGITLDELSVTNMDFPPEIRDQLQSLKLKNLQTDADVDRLIKLQQAGINAIEYQRMQALKSIAEKPSSEQGDIMKTNMISQGYTPQTPSSTISVQPDSFCSNCGTKVGTAKFCPNCGTILKQENKVCKNCGSEIGTAKFCPNCGTPT